jgi:hypothetical protein
MAKNSNIVFTKSFSSYGINIVNTYSDFDLIGKELISSPLVYYYNSFGKAIFDYSQTVNTDDLDLLEIFLQGITNGNTFSVSNGYYVKEQDGITSNINGVYQFDGATGNNIILTTVISVTGINNAEYRYENEYFVNPPKLDLNTGFTGDIAYIIKSVTNEGEISNLGLYEDDLVEISYAGNTANLDRLNVEKVEVSTDGEEFIFVKEPIVNDNRIGVWTTINVYNRGQSTAEYLEKDLTLSGTVFTYDKNGSVLDCFENQNELQGYLRRYGYSDTEVTSVWGYSGLCPETTSTSLNRSTTKTYDKLFSVKYGTNGFIINDVIKPDVPALLGEKYLFYQGDVSNSLATPPQLVFSRVRNNTSERYLLSNNYEISGVPGRGDSYILLTITSDLPSVFYYENLNSPGKGGVVRLTGDKFS